MDKTAKEANISCHRVVFRNDWMRLSVIARTVKAKILCYLPKPKFKMDKWSIALCNPFLQPGQSVLLIL